MNRLKYEKSPGPDMIVIVEEVDCCLEDGLEGDKRD